MLQKLLIHQGSLPLPAVNSLQYLFWSCNSIHVHIVLMPVSEFQNKQ